MLENLIGLVKRQMRNRRPIDLSAVQDAVCNGHPVVIQDIDIAACQIGGRSITFALDRHKDPIQRQNRAGLFYEEPELERIRQIFPQGGTFVDIGANIGNHSIFAAAFLNPAKIIPFEPNPPAYKLLIANVLMNGFQDMFDLRHIGYGVSDTRAGGFAMSERDVNLGAAEMLPDQGDIETVTGDEALRDETPDFIKIDVEGMEMRVLTGLAETITRCAPALMVEVHRKNEATFTTWVEAQGYEIIDTFQRYQSNKNFLTRKRSLA